MGLDLPILPNDKRPLTEEQKIGLRKGGILLSRDERYLPTPISELKGWRKWMARLTYNAEGRLVVATFIALHLIAFKVLSLPEDRWRVEFGDVPKPLVTEYYYFKNYVKNNWSQFKNRSN